MPPDATVTVLPLVHLPFTRSVLPGCSYAHRLPHVTLRTIYTRFGSALLRSHYPFAVHIGLLRYRSFARLVGCLQLLPAVLRLRTFVTTHVYTFCGLPRLFYGCCRLVTLHTHCVATLRLHTVAAVTRCHLPVVYTYGLRLPYRFTHTRGSRFGSAVLPRLVYTVLRLLPFTHRYVLTPRCTRVTAYTYHADTFACCPVCRCTTPAFTVLPFCGCGLPRLFYLCLYLPRSIRFVLPIPTVRYVMVH